MTISKKGCRMCGADLFGQRDICENCIDGGCIDLPAEASEVEDHPKVEEGEIEEIGADGLASLKRTLKFGDIIENGWASERNPTRIITVVKVGKHLHCTDMKGKFLDLMFDKQSRIKVLGNIFDKKVDENQQQELWGKVQEDISDIIIHAEPDKKKFSMIITYLKENYTITNKLKQ
jgi:hypothetical protein